MNLERSQYDIDRTFSAERLRSEAVQCRRWIRDALLPLGVPASIPTGILGRTYESIAKRTRLPSLDQFDFMNQSSPFGDREFIDFLMHSHWIDPHLPVLDIGGHRQINAMMPKLQVINLNYKRSNLRAGDVQGDARCLPIRAQAVGSCVMSCMIQYFSEDDDVLSMLKEAHRVVHLGGTLILAEPQFHTNHAMDRIMASVGESAAQMVMRHPFQYRDASHLAYLLRLARFSDITHIPYVGRNGVQAYVVCGRKK